MFKFRYSLRRPPGLVLKRCPTLSTLVIALLVAVSAAKAEPAPKNLVGRRAIVIDERLSALRERPEMSARLVQRLRRGRVVGILGTVRGRDGQRFLRVFVTRRTHGWILSEALARSGSESDAQRLLQIIDIEKDGFVKVKLASLCVREFRHTKSAPTAYLTLGLSADRAALQLTSAARRRLKQDGADVERLMLNDVGLDRYSRLGVRFRFVAAGERLAYDGAAYRDLLRKYPRSPEAAVARERLNSQ